MGSKGGSSNTSTTQSQSASAPNPQVMAEYQALVNRATNNANQSYNQYGGELVAPLSDQTLSGLGGVNQYAQAAQPFYSTAAGMTLGSAQPIAPTQFSGQAVGQYMNPYTQSVVDATQAQFNNQNQQNAQYLNSNNISSGAFGGDRAGISQAILANQQQTAQAPVIAGLYNQAYNQALSEFNQQQQTGLSAQAFNTQQLGQMGAQLAGIGTSAQQAGLQGASAQLQAGMIPQQEQQSIDTALYNQYLQQQAYPFQSTGWLSNIIEGTGSLSGGTSSGTSTTTQPTSGASQGIGAALSGLGILGNLATLSDARAKENARPVGKTFDGQTIYRFNYKGDPRTQIGLIAQETERHHPEAVAHSGDGAKMVDYDQATRGAARRGHFADGGLLSPEAGVASSLFDAGIMGGLGSSPSGSGSGGMSSYPFGMNNVDWSQINAIGQSPTINSSIDWTNPANDPQTSRAQKSLSGLFDAAGGDYVPTATPTAASKPAPAAAMSAAPSGGTTQRQIQQMATDPSGLGMLQLLMGGPGGQPLLMGDPTNVSPAVTQARGATYGNQLTPAWMSGESGADGGGSSLLSRIANGKARGGRIGYDAGGDVPTFQDPRYSYYTHGDARGAVYHPPTQPPPPPSSVRTKGVISGGDASSPAPAAKKPPRAAPATGRDTSYDPSRGGPRDDSAYDPSRGGPRNDTAYSPGAGSAHDPAIWPGPLPKGPSPAAGPINADTGETIEQPFDFSAGGRRAAGASSAEPPEIFQPGSLSLMDALSGIGRFAGRANPYIATAREIMRSSPAETGELPPRFWPKQIAPPAQQLPSPFAGGSVQDLGSWENEGGSIGRQDIEPTPPDQGAIDAWSNEGGRRTGGRVFRAAGGQLGQTGLGAALAQSPQAITLAGRGPGGEGMGGFATAGKASGGAFEGMGGYGDAGRTPAQMGFGGLFGPRQGFAGGGASDPISAGYQSAMQNSTPQSFVSWVPQPSGQIMGRGAPQPEAPPPPSAGGQGGGGSPGGGAGGLGDIGKSIEGIKKGFGKLFPGSGSQAKTPVDNTPDVSQKTADLAAADNAQDVLSHADASGLVNDASLVADFDAMARGGRIRRDDGGGVFDPPPDQPAAKGAAAQGDQPIPSSSLAGATNAPTFTGSDQIAMLRRNIGHLESGNDYSKLGPATDRGDFAVGRYQVMASNVPSWTKQALGYSMSPSDFRANPDAQEAVFNDQMTRNLQKYGNARDAASVWFTGRPYDVAGPNATDQLGTTNAKYVALATAGGPGGASSSVSGQDSSNQNPGGSGGMSLPPPMDPRQSHYFTPRDYSDPNSSRRELFNAMTYAGFAIMAGRSPNAWVNIGQGGMAAMDYLSKQRELDRNWMTEQAKIDQMSAQERRADADVAIRTNQFNLELAKLKIGFDASRILSGGGPADAGATTPAPAGAAPAAGAPAAAPAGGGASPIAVKPVSPTAAPGAGGASSAGATPAPGGPPASPGATPSGGDSGAAPKAASGAASPGAGQPAGAPSGAGAQPAKGGIPGEGDAAWAGSDPYKMIRYAKAIAVTDPATSAKYMEQGQQILKTANETGRLPNGQIIPGWAEGKAQQESTIEQGKIGAKQFSDEDDEVADNTQANNQQIQRLQALQTIMRKWQPGMWKEHISDIQNVLKTFGVPVTDPSSTYEFLKNATGEVFDALKEQKGQVRNMEIQGLSKANPSTEIPPAANAAIISQMLGTLRMRQDYNKAYTDWRNSPDSAGARNPGAFKQRWMQDPDHDIQKYVDKEQKNFAYLGQDIPKSSRELADGQLYMTPRGAARWNAKTQQFDPEQ